MAANSDGPSCTIGPGKGSGWVGELAELVRDLSDRYDIRVDGRDPSRALRYIAVARRLTVRPYAVVAADPDELRAAIPRPAVPPARARSSLADQSRRRSVAAGTALDGQRRRRRRSRAASARATDDQRHLAAPD